MKFLKNLLKAPIRNTVIILMVSLLAYLVLTFISLFLTRVMCAASYLDTGSCHGTNLQMFSSVILNDFEFLFRITAELSVVVLISQLIYRIAKKSPK